MNRRDLLVSAGSTLSLAAVPGLLEARTFSFARPNSGWRQLTPSENAAFVLKHPRTRPVITNQVVADQRLSTLMDYVGCAGFSQAGVLTSSRSSLSHGRSLIRPDSCAFPEPCDEIEGTTSYSWTNAGDGVTTTGYSGWEYPYGEPTDTSIIWGSGSGEIFGPFYQGLTYYPTPVPIAPATPACVAAIAAASINAAEKILAYISANQGKYGASIIKFAKLFTGGLVSVAPFAFLDGLVALLLGPEFLALLAVAGVGVAVWASWLACKGGK